MAVTAWKDPGTISSQTRSGGSVSWTNPTRALTSNDSYSTCVNPGSGSHWLWATNFGFTTADIPTGSTINGIEVRVERSQTTSASVEGPTTSYFKMIIGGAEAGTQKTTSGHVPTTDTYETKGASNDVFGTSITSAQARASDTGWAFAFQDLDYTTTTISVDNVQIRYYYTAPASAKNWGAVIGGVLIGVYAAIENLGSILSNRLAFWAARWSRERTVPTGISNISAISA